MFNEDIVQLSEEILSGKIPDSNMEEVIRRGIAYIVMNAIMDSAYREEVDLYIQSVES